MSRVENAADFRLNAKRSISAEDRIKFANAAERILRKLGLDKPASAQSTSPLPPARSLLKEPAK